MMTLKEARRLQKEIQNKILFKFFVFSVISGALGYIIVYYSNLAERSVSFYLLPVIAVIYVGWKTGIQELFTPSEVMGQVTDINIYQVSSQRVKGER